MDQEKAMTDKQTRALLQKLRTEMVGFVEAVAEDAEPVALDQTQQGRLSRMDAIQQQAMAAETKRRRLRQVQMIDAALQRLDDGEYGFCVVCGEPIGSGRLALDPAVPTCITHAS